MAEFERKVVALGSSGLVGSQFVEASRHIFDLVTPTHQELDILDPKSVKQFIISNRPSTVINFVAYTQVDKAEGEKGDENGVVYKLNASSVGELANICADENIHLVHISTGFVFGGEKTDAPYQETDQPNPLDWYAQTKLIGEELALKGGGRVTIPRIDMPWGALNYSGKVDFGNFFVNQLRLGKGVNAADQKITPIYIGDLSQALIAMIESDHCSGIYHLGTSDSTTPFDFAGMVAKKWGFDQSLVTSVTFEGLNGNKPAKRPKNTWMDTSKFKKEFGEQTLHAINDALDIFKSQVDSAKVD